MDGFFTLRRMSNLKRLAKPRKEPAGQIFAF